MLLQLKPVVVLQLAKNVRVLPVLRQLQGSGNRRDYHQGSARQFREQAERHRKTQRQKDCQVLNLPEDCDEAQARDAYIKLAKLYHPDGGTEEADSQKFQKVDTAYKNLLKDFADFRHNRHKIEGEYGLYYQESEPDKQNEDVDEPDIKHTAPQHRQYLSNDGVGSGTPFEREKQYTKYRRAKAAENIMEYRVQQVSKSSGEDVTALAKNTRASKKIKTGIGVERLVEDLIQESMAKGEFDNLSGKGQPLKDPSSYNPYIDFTTHKLNQVLIENGFAPEWILLEKTIRSEMRRLRGELSLHRHKYGAVLTPQEEAQWKETIEKLFKEDCTALNKMIEKFNLTVPSLHRQMMTFQLDREGRNALSTFSPEMQATYANTNFGTQTQTSKTKGGGKNQDSEGFMGLIFSIFK